MLSLFRHHIEACAAHGTVTGRRCPRRPRCPIHYAGLDGSGETHKPQSITDPRTASGVRDWDTAREILRMMETRVPLSTPIEQIKICVAVEHYLKMKSAGGRVGYNGNLKLMNLFKAFLAAEPRCHQLLAEVSQIDLIDFCSGWTGSNNSKAKALLRLVAFLHYCYQSNFTAKNLGDELRQKMRWNHQISAKEPFSEGELESIWNVLPAFANVFSRSGERIRMQTEAFAYILRYTGLDVSTLLTLPKASVRANKILTYRLKTGHPVWTVIPAWVLDKLLCAPHDSELYFFWTGKGKPYAMANKWFRRLRKLFDLAGLPHRSGHDFRRHFAVEHLLKGTPIEDVSRLLGHSCIKTTLTSYAHWFPVRQVRLEQQQQSVWQQDALHLRITNSKSQIGKGRSSSI